MRFRILPKILLIAGFLALICIINYRNQIRGSWQFQFEKLKAYSDNFFYLSSNKLNRHRPVSLLQQETELQLYIGEPFKGFKRKDWEKFWKIIYGIFPREAPAKPGFPVGLRQLTREEIVAELISLYPQPFTYFRDNHWQTFFSIILKK